MILSFSDFMNKDINYSTFSSPSMIKRIEALKGKWRQLVTYLDPKLKGVDLTIKIFQNSANLLSNFSIFKSFLVAPFEFSRELRRWTDFSKGVKAINSVLNFTCTLRHVILTISGLSLFVLSSLELIERHQLANLTIIKDKCRAIPIFGVLPYGGLISFSLIGLMGVLASFSWDKNKKMNKEISHIGNKLKEWKKGLTLQKLTEKVAKSQTIVQKIQEDITSFHILLKEGKDKENEILNDLKNTNIRQLFFCQQAIKKLHLLLDQKKKSLLKYESKYNQWVDQQLKWDTLTKQDIETFRQIKENKWQRKFKKIQKEKNINNMGAGSYLTVISNQVLILGACFFGFSMNQRLVGFRVGLDLLGMFCDVRKTYLITHLTHNG